jgi:hypothetical protein
LNDFSFLYEELSLSVVAEGIKVNQMGLFCVPLSYLLPAIKEAFRRADAVIVAFGATQ